jgi:holo-[acyl-carrier protein] synthase
MIVGMGTDLVFIPRFRKLIAQYGDRVLRRLFHPSEIQNKPLIEEKCAQYFASRWAVKEATVKALGQSGIGSKQMYIEKRGSPIPHLVLEGEALERLNQLTNSSRTVHKHVSISHDHDYAIATVIIENR